MEKILESIAINGLSATTLVISLIVLVSILFHAVKYIFVVFRQDIKDRDEQHAEEKELIRKYMENQIEEQKKHHKEEIKRQEEHHSKQHEATMVQLGTFNENLTHITSVLERFQTETSKDIDYIKDRINVIEGKIT